MARSMIRNQIGEKIQTLYVPMSSSNAADFAEAMLQGTYKIYEEASKVGSDATVVAAKEVTLQLQDNSTHKKTYLRFIAKQNKSIQDISTALIGKTFNGVKVDRVVVTSHKLHTFA